MRVTIQIMQVFATCACMCACVHTPLYFESVEQLDDWLQGNVFIKQQQQDRASPHTVPPSTGPAIPPMLIPDGSYAAPIVPAYDRGGAGVLLY